MWEAGKCVLCASNAELYGIPPLNMQYRYRCENCGEFLVSDRMQGCIPFEYKDAMHLLSGYVRDMTENNKEVIINNETMNSILSSPLIPQSPVEKLDKLLLWYFRQSDYFGKLIEVTKQRSICYAANDEEMECIYEISLDEGLFIMEKSNAPLYFDNQRIRLSYKGYQYCKELKVKKSDSLNVFVAMCFKNDFTKVYQDAIEPAITECGFRAVRVDNIEHNNDITDEIIAGIKNSRFIIADLTEYRGGVYYEAGYAKGMGLPVIFTCRSNWLKDVVDADGKITQQGVHFDINHENIIIWETGGEDALRNRIVNRIRATIL